MTDITHLQQTHSVQYGERNLRFHWSPRGYQQRKARIHVHPNGVVEVETPHDVSLKEAKQALLKRARWVTRHLKDIEARRAAIYPRQYVSGETLFYLGRRHTLKIIQGEKEQGAKLLRGQLRVTTKDPNPATVKQLVGQWYKERAQDVFDRRLKTVAENLTWLKTLPPWTIRQMKTQWGSCSPSGTIILNPHLVKTPTRCIDYVILHELCHLKEHNHSQKFYRLLEKEMQDWEAIKARLDGMSEFYLNE